MEDEALGKLLRRLQEHYRTPEPSDQMVDDWWDEFHATPDDAMDAAASSVIANEDYHPRIARFREYLSMQNPQARMTQPLTTCVLCEGTGWRESTVDEKAVASRPTRDPRTKKLDGPPEVYEHTYPPGVYPCQRCQPARFERWRDQWVPEARRTKPVTSKDRFDYNPAAKLAEARKVLSDLGGLTRNADDLEDDTDAA
jgi:hypothetical protein